MSMIDARPGEVEALREKSVALSSTSGLALLLGTVELGAESEKTPE
jgi:hypothetical protein